MLKPNVRPQNILFCATDFIRVRCWLRSDDVTAGLRYVTRTQEYVLPCSFDYGYLFLQ